jgi:FG-GAP repeat/RTX calcium-binding nonapeptide repeat (4 copies)
MSVYSAVFDLSSLDGTNGFKINGEGGGDDSGHSVSSAGDVNGDGLDDLIVGAEGADPNGRQSGASYVVFGKASGFGAKLNLSSLDGNNGFKIKGEAAYDNSGLSVSDAGDVNGDGFADLIVGAPGADPNGSRSGASYVVFGKASGFGATLELSSLDGTNGFQINGETGGDFSGFSVSSAGDVNGDGFGDQIVGAFGADPNGAQSGASYVVFGHLSGFGAILELSSLDGTNGFKISSEGRYDYGGYSVASAGDVNGDRFADLIVGAPHARNYMGASYVVFGKASGFGAMLELSSLDGTNGFQINGEFAYDQSGRAVSTAGDLDGDGFADLIVAAPSAHGYSGSSYVIFGKGSGFDATLKVSNLDGSNGFRIDGESREDQSGCSVASAGDVNGDGFDDLIIGARGADPNGNVSGASYVVFGKASGFGATLELSSLDGNNGFQINGEGAYDASGSSVTAAGDVNGDGFADLIVGATGAFPNGNNSGASYVIFGSMPDEAVTRIGSAIGQTIHGGDFDDTLSGLGGNDTLIGGRGSDLLRGGVGADQFVYTEASNSSSLSHDTIARANFAADKFDTPSAVTGIDAGIDVGTLSKVSFDGDLASAVDAGHLAANHAVLFTPNTGGLAGRTFLIVDVNGVAGYQAGDDLVIQLTHAQNLGALGAEDFI